MKILRWHSEWQESIPDCRFRSHLQDNGAAGGDVLMLDVSFIVWLGVKGDTLDILVTVTVVFCDDIECNVAALAVDTDLY